MILLFAHYQPNQKPINNKSDFNLTFPPGEIWCFIRKLNNQGLKVVKGSQKIVSLNEGLKLRGWFSSIRSWCCFHSISFLTNKAFNWKFMFLLQYSFCYAPMFHWIRFHGYDIEICTFSPFRHTRTRLTFAFKPHTTEQPTSGHCR